MNDFCIINSPFGRMAIVSAGEGRVRIKKIYLPRRGDLKRLVAREFPGAREASFSSAAFQPCFDGKDGSVPFRCLDLKGLKLFQKDVLTALAKVPAGKVISYARLAARAGAPGAARAVGAVMAGNPLPIALPCHRVVRSDGSLGGYGGGLKMKRVLLEMEGVEFDKKGRVKPDCFC